MKSNTIAKAYYYADKPYGSIDQALSQMLRDKTKKPIINLKSKRINKEPPYEIYEFFADTDYGFVSPGYITGEITIRYWSKNRILFTQYDFIYGHKEDIII